MAWDLIVVGAGSSGAALAARCASAGRRVLLLEAGIDFRSAALPEEWRSPNPMNGLLSPTIGDYLWPGLDATRTEWQEPYLYWRGRGVGGSSTVNGQIAIRPPMDDFDSWPAGWRPADVLPHFVALESDQDFAAETYHGGDGPTPVYRAPVAAWGAVDEALRGAALAHGFEWAPDVNAPGATGVSPYPINSRDGRRVSTNDAYLEPARELATLEVRGGCLVDTVVFDGTRAVGVRLAGGEVLHADQVVLSAGVIASPTILLRSGIGPADALRALGVEVRADLPVGRGMQDHPMVMAGVPLLPGHAAGPEDRHTNCCVRYDSGTGGLGNDMMLVALNQNLLAMSSADMRAGAGGIGVWVNQVFSRGSVELTGLDPATLPVVRENMLSDERDLARLRDGARLLAKLIDSAPVRAVCGDDPWQAPVNHPLRAALDGSDTDLDRHLRATAVDTQHGTSTCRMGSPSDATTVVDPDCRVLGVEGLRVVDASIFPSVPRANTNLTAIMVGELMADRL
ncbi:GMC family oxidoreductase [Pseudonocardia spinosispora]|uniref:GMC family oxidoreductase n=1 Tax=Pseudonocardia spinosispora TaxID=103441 RepID=UPI0003F626CA|nr:GMC oxidoreductase [Pseudonocardia spinosispora]